MLLQQTDIGIEFAIYVPCEASTDELDGLVEETIEEAGGMTVTPVTGVWRNGEGENVVEDVHILSFITAHDKVERVLELIQEMCTLLLEGGQSAILVRQGDRNSLITSTTISTIRWKA